MTYRTAYVTHFDCSRHDTGWRHPEHQGRLPAVARAVHRDMLTLFDRLLEVEGMPATQADLTLAHSTEYVAGVERRCREAAASGEVLPVGAGVVVSGASWDAAVAAVGCVLTAVAKVAAGEARNAFCAVRPPGHGAGRERPGNFGIFNSVAIAALRLLRNGTARVWVVEWGSRPGGGTASILGEEPAARVLSVHVAGAGGARLAGSGVVQRRLAAGAGPGEMLAALRSVLDEGERGMIPDFILLSLGCDALESDPLGSLALDARAYFDLTTELRDRAERLCGGRLVSVLEEGYDADAMARAVLQHIRALAGLPPIEG